MKNPGTIFLSTTLYHGKLEERYKLLVLAVHGETPVHYNEVKKKKKSIHILYASTNSRKCKQIYSDMTEGLN